MYTSIIVEWLQMPNSWHWLPRRSWLAAEATALDVCCRVADNRIVFFDRNDGLGRHPSRTQITDQYLSQVMWPAQYVCLIVVADRRGWYTLRRRRRLGLASSVGRSATAASIRQRRPAITACLRAGSASCRTDLDRRLMLTGWSHVGNVRPLAWLPDGPRLSVRHSAGCTRLSLC